MFKNIKRVLFSPLFLNASVTKKIAYLGVMTALCVVSNTFLEIKFADVQFSLTIFLAIIMGVLLGPVCGFTVCFLGDAVGYLFNSMGYVYMFWVGLSVSLCSFIAGIIFYGIKLNFKGGLYVKLALISIFTFLICTVGVNSTGFYYYNMAMGFSTAVMDYITANFGGNVSFWAYIAYRLVFKGQIYNSIFNYALAFIAVPLLLRIKYFRIEVKEK